MALEKEVPENIINMRDACLAHADDLLRAAKSMLENENLPNVAYHLAVLAMEEVGKSVLFMMGHFANQHESNWSPEKFYDDHVKKIFWALWAPTLRGGPISKAQIDELQGLSLQIHDTRLQGLYVDFKNGGPVLPRDAVTAVEAKKLIELTTARLELEKLHKFGKIREENFDNLKWFLTATENEEKRRLIFASKSLAKLTESGNVHRWISWLKEQFDTAEKEALEISKQELQRKAPTDDIEGNKDKWKIKIRFYSNSHSIRPKALNAWNRWSNWIKLYSADGKKNHFIAEFTLPKHVTVHALWWAGWGLARRFITALNIGAMGSFWWYVPEQVSYFYEKIIDLERKNGEMRIERSPALKIDWGNRALTEEDMRHTVICFSGMPSENESELGKGMGAYITGLSFLNKTDIHIQFEANTFEFFYKSLKHGTAHFNDWSVDAPFAGTFEKILIESGCKKGDTENYIKLAEQFECGRPSFAGLTLTLNEVAVMKAISDRYYLFKFLEAAKQRRAKEETV